LLPFGQAKGRRLNNFGQAKGRIKRNYQTLRQAQGDKRKKN
jgi:hypothetical protein